MTLKGTPRSGRVDAIYPKLREFAKTFDKVWYNSYGGYEKKVRGLLGNEGILERVIFTGMLNGKEKLEAFVGSDLFVLPSYSENFGMAVVEAMACGTQVISPMR